MLKANLKRPHHSHNEAPLTNSRQEEVRELVETIPNMVLVRSFYFLLAMIIWRSCVQFFVHLVSGPCLTLSEEFQSGRTWFQRHKTFLFVSGSGTK